MKSKLKTFQETAKTKIKKSESEGDFAVGDPSGFKHVNSGTKKQYGLAREDSDKSSTEKQQKLEQEYAVLTKDLESTQRQVDSLTKLIEHYANDPKGAEESQLQLDIEVAKLEAIKVDQQELWNQLANLKNMNNWKAQHVKKALPTPGVATSNPKPPKPYQITQSPPATPKSSLPNVPPSVPNQPKPNLPSIPPIQKEAEAPSQEIAPEPTPVEIPSGWETAYTDDGAVYYWHPETNETRWPDEFFNDDTENAQLLAPVDTISQNLPDSVDLPPPNDILSEWQQVFDEQGQPYYYNETTGETAWEIPQ